MKIKISKYLPQLIVFLIMILGGINASAQSLQVSGVVMETADGSTLPGVNILIKGTSNGTATDRNGNYSVIVSSLQDTLIFSYIGYITKVIPINGRRAIDIGLKAKAIEGEELVVLGYEKTSNRSVTTSITSISSKDIESWTTGNVANALENKIPGVLIRPGGGLPGSQPSILVQGLSSLSSNNTPLIIVDGVETGHNSLNFINPSDIQSINVLKDASAAAIYGARAAQGVILITTKGGTGKPSIHAEVSTGVDILPKVNLADAPEYVRIMNRIAENSGKDSYFSDLSSINNTDYWDLAYDVGQVKNVNLNASGGKDGFNFYGSLGYYRKDSYDATNRGGNWNKFTARFNADLDVSDIFTMGIRISPHYEHWLSSPNPLYSAYVMDPTTAPFKTEEDVYSNIPDGFMDMTAFNPYYSEPNRSTFNNATNPVFGYRTNFNQGEYFGTQYAGYLEFDPVENFTLKTELTGFINTNQYNNYDPKYYLMANSNRKEVSLSSSTAIDTRWKITNTAHYKLDLGNHHIDAIAGQSADQYTYKGTSASRKDIPLDDPSFRYISSAATVTGGSGSYQPGTAGGNAWGKMISFFSSLRYNYKEKYYLAGTMRTDGSSLVNPQYQWGYFPTASAGWILSSEPFFEHLKSIDYLKLRASWGRSGGNLPHSVGAYLTTYSPTTYVNADKGAVLGYAPSNFANPAIKWEVNKNYTLGLDTRFFDDKLSLTFEKFVKKSDNLLLNVGVDFTLGYPQGYYPTQLANVGKMTTNGWDISLGYNNRFGSKFKFSANLTVSHFKTIVNSVGNQDPIFLGENNDVITTYRSRLTEGHEPGAWYGYKLNGVFQSDQAAESYVNKDGDRLQPDAKAGDLIYRDINRDGRIDSDDLTDLGSPWPKLTGGLTLKLDYGNIGLTAEFYSSLGATYFNSYLLNMSPAYHRNFESGLGDEFWHGQGTSNTYPILRTPDSNGNFSNMSSFFLEKDNFLKCQLIQLGYTFPSYKWIPTIQHLRIYASVQNVFTITSYSGLNPDLPWNQTVGYDGGFAKSGVTGNDSFQAMLPREFIVGISLDL